jgi:hypothetical protein
MPVRAGALAQVVRENVRRLEPEMLANLHTRSLRGMPTREPSH